MEEDTFSLSKKKKRLTVDQVKTLERIFEEENKLDPEKKIRIAEETGLQPRQVAVWFQNRRARWKSKQLERDYCVLKAHYDSLNIDYNNLQHETQVLTSMLKELRAKVSEENREKEQSMSLTEPKQNNEVGSNKIIQMVPTYYNKYPEKKINMVKLADLFNLNSGNYAPNLPS